MLISQENKEELIFKCVDLISKTFVEIGQSTISSCASDCPNICRVRTV